MVGQIKGNIPCVQWAYLIVLIAARMILSHPQDKVKDRHKGTDGIWVPSEHDVAEADIIICCDVAGRHACERSLQFMIVSTA